MKAPHGLRPQKRQRRFVRSASKFMTNLRERRVAVAIGMLFNTQGGGNESFHNRYCWWVDRSAHLRDLGGCRSRKSVSAARRRCSVGAEGPECRPCARTL